MQIHCCAHALRSMVGLFYRTFLLALRSMHLILNRLKYICVLRKMNFVWWDFTFAHPCSSCIRMPNECKKKILICKLMFLLTQSSNYKWKVFITLRFFLRLHQIFIMYPLQLCLVSLGSSWFENKKQRSTHIHTRTSEHDNIYFIDIHMNECCGVSMRFGLFEVWPLKRKIKIFVGFCSEPFHLNFSVYWIASAECSHSFGHYLHENCLPETFSLSRRVRFNFFSFTNNRSMAVYFRP